MSREGLRTIVVTEKSAGFRLDRFLHELHPEIAVNRWRRKLADGDVLVDGRPAVKGLILEAGQKVVFAAGLPAELMPTGPLPEAGPLAVLYRDDNLLAIDKPAGCHTHPLRPDESGTLANRLIAAYPELSGIGGFGPLQPGLLNRLDYGTSGIVLVARSAPAWRRLRAEFAAHRVRKEYLAIVDGALNFPLTIDCSLTHDRKNPARMVPSPPASPCRGCFPARTEVLPEKVLSQGRRTRVRLVMYTGVMHQLRAHLAGAGHPLSGDLLYGGSFPAPFFLHCRRIEFPSGPAIVSEPAQKLF